MNPTEQKNHRTVTQALGRQISDVMDVTDAALATLAQESRDRVNEERTHRLKMAEDQRSYVDAEDRKLRTCCQERWDATGDAQRSFINALAAFRDRTIWGRLRWIIRGV